MVAMKQFSQFGQAEWLLQFSNSIGINHGVVFEAGAHTPKSISNSMCFIEAGWKAILVEAFEEYCNEWRLLQLDNVDVFSRGIDYANSGLESLLSDINAPRNIDIFFLDIDGGEYQLLKGLNQYRPKLLCVEYDNSYPLSIEFVPNQIRHGVQASSLAIYKLMIAKGYTYVRSFFQDHIFIANEVLDRVKDSIQFSIGKDAFASSASSHLYSFHAALLNQQEDKGGDGISFYSSKVSILIDNGYLEEARHCYYLLSQVFHSYRILVQQTKGELFSHRYSLSLEEFDRSFSQYLFHS